MMRLRAVVMKKTEQARKVGRVFNPQTVRYSNGLPT